MCYRWCLTQYILCFTQSSGQIIICTELKFPVYLVFCIYIYISCSYILFCAQLAFYSVSVLTSAGLSPRVARYLTPAFTLVGIIESLILVFIVGRLKRRVLMLGGLAGMLVAQVVLTIALLYQVSL